MGKLVRYALGVAATLLAIEGVFRLWEPAFASSGDRILTKAAVLDAQGSVEAVFFGTSRSWDAISPRLFASELALLQPGAEVRGFNLAVTSSTLETLEELARRFAGRPGMRLAVVELSGAQLETRSPPAASQDDAVSDFFARHLRLIEHRAALRGESLLRLPELLLYPGCMDGSEILFVEQLRAVAGVPEAPAAPADLAALRPAAIPTEAPPADPRAARLLAVARLLRSGGAGVVFMVPPIEGGEPAMRPFAAALAREFPVWDFGATALPARSFRDTTHLGREGRALFSRMLAGEAARAGLLPPGLARRQ